MPDISGWLTEPDNLDTSPQFDILGMMHRRGQDVIITRGGETLPAQKLIFAPQTSQAAEVTGQAGSANTSGRERGVLIGFRDYPGQTTANLMKGDRFVIGTAQYRIVYVDDSLPGRREASAMSVQ